MNCKTEVTHGNNLLSYHNRPSVSHLSQIGGKEMIRYFVPLLGSFLHEDWLQFWFYPIFALAFLVTVPCIIRQFFRG